MPEQQEGDETAKLLLGKCINQRYIFFDFVGQDLITSISSEVVSMTEYIGVGGVEVDGKADEVGQGSVVTLVKKPLAKF